MTSNLKIFLLLLIFSACGQNPTVMKTPDDANEKLKAFIAKKKFVAEEMYPGIATDQLRPIFTHKINEAAADFKTIAFSAKPTDKKYQDKIKTGLSRFADVYPDLDTEDKERVCSYFEELMDIVGLQSSDGQLNKFMYGFDPNEEMKTE